jgi:hypothetical protein
MRELFRDIALSFCPDSLRTVHPPHSSSRLLLVAIFTGPLQTALCAYWLLSGYKAFLVARAAQYGDVLNRANQTTQAWIVLVFFIEYVIFHPLALFLSYMALEGFLRFAGALCVSEVVPSLPVVLAFRLRAYIHKRQSQREIAPLSSLPDSVEVLPEGERLRIAGALPKPRWTPSLTIGIQGEWYELEAVEYGQPPRSYVYILRRAPVSKVLRGYEEYDVTAGVSAGPSETLES